MKNRKSVPHHALSFESFARLGATGLTLLLVSGCCSPPPQPQGQPNTFSQVGLRRAVIPAGSCVAYLQVTWTPEAVSQSGNGAVQAFAVPPDQPVRIDGRPGNVAGQRVCDYIVDASPRPAAGRWRIEVKGIAINTLMCTADLVAGAHNYHAFMTGAQGCNTTTTGLHWVPH